MNIDPIRIQEEEVACVMYSRGMQGGGELLIHSLHGILLHGDKKRVFFVSHRSGLFGVI